MSVNDNKPTGDAPRPPDTVDQSGAVGQFKAGLWTDGKLVLEGLAHRIRPDGSIELTQEETMLIARLTSSLIFI